MKINDGSKLFITEAEITLNDMSEYSNFLFDIKNKII